MAKMCSCTKVDHDQLVADGLWRGFAGSDEEFLRVADELGTAVPSRPTSPVLHNLTPVSAQDAPTKSLSAMHGLGAFPFHTDAAHHRRPPRWTLMRCVEPGSEGRATLLVDGKQLQLPDRMWRELERAVWWVASGGRAFPASVVSHVEGERMIRYDRGCMRPTVATFDATVESFEHAVEDARHLQLEWQRNDMVIFENWRMLHARADSQGRDAGVRLLQRILVR